MAVLRCGREKAALRRLADAVVQPYFRSSTNSDTIRLAFSLLSGWPWSFSTVTVATSPGALVNGGYRRIAEAESPHAASVYGGRLICAAKPGR